MKGKCEFFHVGLTVSDMDKTIEFYKKYFGFTLEMKAVFPVEFISAVPQLYDQEEGVYSDFAILRSPDGFALELFQFSNMEPAQPARWNQPGYHHIALRVDSVPKIYETMAADGVKFYFEPKLRGEPENDGYWVFLKDPDGNMVELQD